MKVVKSAPVVSALRATTRAMETTAMISAYSMTCEPSSSLANAVTAAGMALNNFFMVNSC